MSVRFSQIPAGRIIVGFIAAVIIFFTGCTEDPSFVGKNILPPSDNINIKYDTSSVIQAWTTKWDHVITNSNKVGLVGSTRDNIFGFTRAMFMTPISNSINAGLGTDIVVDSLILTMAVDSSYGDNQVLTIMAYEVTKDTIGRAGPYYSDDDPTDYYNHQILGSTVFHPATDTSFRIKITNQEYLDKFVNAEDTVFKDPNLFMDTFKGILIKSSQVTGDGGSLLVLNPDAYSDSLGRISNMKLYFKNAGGSSPDTTLVYPIFFPSSYQNTITNAVSYYARPTFFTHVYTGSLVANALDQPGTNDSIQFITGTAGLGVRLSFPEIAKWLDSTNVAINKAELIIPADTTIINQNMFPEKLALLKVNNDDTYSFIDDFWIDPSQSSGSATTGSTFSGYYDDIQRGAYVFNIGYHFQEYIDGKVNTMNFILLDGDYSNLRNISPQTLNSSSVRKTILKSPGPSGIRLRIIYTEF